jgi:transcriptional regulator GlxA family with amidase domain
VCSGSLVLGVAGLPKGDKAISHWSYRDALAGSVAIPTEVRVVRDRNRITGADMTAGLDFGLTMVAEMRDRTYAECCELVSEYGPDPPFHAGSLRSAPPEESEPMMKMTAGFR